jgi:hypothetical protein
MLICNQLEAGSSKLEAWLTAADFFKLRASSLLPQAYICLAGGRMLVFQHPAFCHE